MNGRLIASGGEFGSSETVFIGGSCGVNAVEGGTCPEDYSLLNVTTHTRPCEPNTNWGVFDASTGHIYATNDKASLAKCIPQKDCYQFTIYDSYVIGGGAEWTLEYDGDFVTCGDRNYGRSESTAFGPRC